MSSPLIQPILVHYTRTIALGGLMVKSFVTKLVGGNVGLKFVTKLVGGKSVLIMDGMKFDHLDAKLGLPTFSFQ